MQRLFVGAQKQEVQNTKVVEDCWAKNFAVFKEYNLQRLQSIREDSAEGKR